MLLKNKKKGRRGINQSKESKCFEKCFFFFKELQSVLCILSFSVMSETPDLDFCVSSFYIYMLRTFSIKVGSSDLLH